VLGVTARLLGAGSGVAEEAAQETMTALVDALPRFRGESTITYFATRIAVRTALQMDRRDRARTRRETAVGEPPPPGVPSPAEDVMATRRREAMRELLSRIPAEQAEALALFVVVGLSLEEIGQVMNVPVNTVRSRIRRGKEDLRRRIDRSPNLKELLG
jgi:RNA polymerase sigma-70 factor (ECF subfamily)